MKITIRNGKAKVIYEGDGVVTFHSELFPEPTRRILPEELPHEKDAREDALISLEDRVKALEKIYLQARADTFAAVRPGELISGTLPPGPEKPARLVIEVLRMLARETQGESCLTAVDVLKSTLRRVEGLSEIRLDWVGELEVEDIMV